MTRSRRLGLELLEARDVPAGNVTAAVTNGILTITGDEADNALWFQISPAAVIINPFGGTSVNGQPADTQVTLPAATGLRADLGDGDDTLTLVGTSDLILPKGATIALGDGFNIVNLITSGTIDLASLNVTGTDGFDLVQVTGGAGNPNKIAGTASFNLGDGGGQTQLENLNLPGAGGLKVTAGAGDDSLILTNLTVKKTVTAKLGPGDFNGVSISGGAIGGLAAAFLGGSLNLTGTTVTGNVAFSSAAFPVVDVADTKVAGTLMVKTTQALVGSAYISFSGTGTLGAIAVDTVGYARLYFSPASSYTVTRDVKVVARTSSAIVTLDGATLAARSVAVSTQEAPVQMAVGNAGHLQLTKNLTLAGASGSSLSQDQGGNVDIDGDVTVTTAIGFANIQVGLAELKARNVTVSAAGGTAFLSQFAGSAIDLTGRLMVSGRNWAELTASGGTLTTAGDVKITSRDDAEYIQAGASTALAVGGKLNVRSEFGKMLFSALGKSLTVAGATTLDGGYKEIVNIHTTDLSTITLPVTIIGGTRISTASGAAPKVPSDPTNETYLEGEIFMPKPKRPPPPPPEPVDGVGLGLAIILGGAEGHLGIGPTLYSAGRATTRPDAVARSADAGQVADIQIGGPGRPVTIEGNVLIRTGGADDAVTLQDVTVTGKTIVLTGGGEDTLTIDDGSTFAGSFSADMGTGNDTISIAQDTGQAAPVTFTGKATILAWAGADMLLLGSTAGDANSTAVFAAAGSKIDGGTGINSFDDELGLFDGLILGTGILGWTDPTP